MKMRALIFCVILFFWTGICSANVEDDIRSLQWTRQSETNISNSAILHKSSFQLTRTQTSEIVRGQDLLTSMKETLLRSKAMLESRIETMKMFMASGARDNSSKSAQIKEMVERNRILQEESRRRQQEAKRAMTERNRYLQQQIKDMVNRRKF